MENLNNCEPPLPLWLITPEGKNLDSDLKSAANVHWFDKLSDLKNFKDHKEKTVYVIREVQPEEIQIIAGKDHRYGGGSFLLNMWGRPELRILAGDILQKSPNAHHHIHLADEKMRQEIVDEIQNIEKKKISFTIEIEKSPQSKFKQYSDEPLNPKVKNAKIEGSILQLDLGGSTIRLELPDTTIQAYKDGALPLNALANAMYSKIELKMAKEIEENPREKTQNLKI